ncbi:hypothetical protein BDC45DRAFT_598770 [Circinella umbellata]|nr:hypothetical protein BDC45DRAFT_598770 [Circinella umbellata]
MSWALDQKCSVTDREEENNVQLEVALRVIIADFSRMTQVGKDGSTHNRAKNDGVEFDYKKVLQSKMRSYDDIVVVNWSSIERLVFMLQEKKAYGNNVESLILLIDIGYSTLMLSSGTTSFKVSSKVILVVHLSHIEHVIIDNISIFQIRARPRIDISAEDGCCSGVGLMKFF